MFPLTPEQLCGATGCTLVAGRAWEPHINAALARWQIDSPARMAAWIAQCSHESMRFSTLSENLRYLSPEQLCRVWPSRFPSIASTQGCIDNPVELADRVYRGRMGNALPGDGFRFRGRGLLAITGRDSYTACAAALGIDCVTTPDMLLQPEHAAMGAAWWWSSRDLNDLADRRDFVRITRVINGGITGLTDRLAIYRQACQVLGVN